MVIYPLLIVRRKNGDELFGMSGRIAFPLIKHPLIAECHPSLDPADEAECRRRHFYPFVERGILRFDDERLLAVPAGACLGHQGEAGMAQPRSEEHTSELQSQSNLE